MAKKFDNGRPGFLIFYEWMDALEEYSFEECGKFICAVGDYSRYGTIPDFEDKGLRSIWKMAKPTIDSNAASYEEKRRKTRYSSYVGVQKKAFQKKPENVGKEPVEGIDYLSYDDWYNEVDNINQIHADGSERQRMVANGNKHNNNLNTNNNPNSNINDNSNNNLNPNINNSCSMNERKKGVQGEENSPSFNALVFEWRRLMKEGKKQDAFPISNQLFRLGYDADPVTLEIKRRKEK